ncbi:MAG: FixH family protein [Candidatus Eremiobacteraeota bacterium]|nr:FixH family protein [Candidatus Eremiobacteraeota bacterium]MBC5808758.1 FixH family protein [Candidatus Eremiobacteraeota bacterium]
MSMTFAPSPPVKGNETITISVNDASGSSVKGASVRSTSNMPAMSMSGPTMVFQDNGDGTYSAVTNLNYSTKWVFRVSASQMGKSGKAEFRVDVP